MKVNRVSLLNARNSASNAFSTFSSNIQNTQNVREFSKSAGMGVTSLGKSQVQKGAGASLALSFKGRNVKQVVHILPEDGIMFWGGGVGTVIRDWIKKFSGFDPSVEHIFIMPYYNAEIVKDSEGEMTGVKTVLDNAGNTVIKDPKGNNHVIKELLSFAIEDNDMDTKTTKNVACKLFDGSDILYEDMFKEYSPKGGKKPRLLLVQTPKASSMAKQYGYAYSGGNMYENYTQNAKAVVEALKKMGEIDENFSPRQLVVHDYHNNAALKFIMDEAAKGNDLYKDLNIGYIFHNAGRGGYQGIEAGALDIFKAYASPEEFEKVVKSRTFCDLFSRRGKKAALEQKEFWQKLMPSLVDEYGEINPSMLPLWLGEKGYVKLATVSPGYAEECATNPEFAAGLTGHMNKLQENGILKGITNGLQAPDRDSQISYDASYYYHQKYLNKLQDNPIKYKDGKTLQPLLAFNPENPNIGDIRKVKKDNKYNFLERIVRYANNQIDENTLPTVKDKRINPIDIVLGLTGRSDGAKIYSTLDQSTLKSVQNENARLFVSWGRGDFQKGIDELLMGVKKYVTSGSDDGKSIFVICGGLPKDGKGLPDGFESVRIQNLIDEMCQMTQLKGRFAYIDGWSPATVLGSAGDFGIFSSRFEPCGLTPQEMYARGGAVIGSHTGGMKSTIKALNDNSDNINEATGLTTKLGYYEIEPRKMPREQLEGTEAGKKFLEVYDNVVEKAKKELGVEEMTPQVKKMADKSSEIGAAVRAYRDEVMADEFAKQIARAANNITDEQLDQMHLNAASLKADWNNNDAINDGVCAFESYKHHFFKDFADGATPEAPKASIIDKEFLRTLIDDAKGQVDEAAESGAKGIIKKLKNMPFAAKAAGILGIVAVAIGSVYLARKAKANKTT